MTYPPYPGEPNPAQPTSGQPSGWGPPQPPAYPDPTLPQFGAQPPHGQPQYGQPQYGQPQYDPNQPPPFDPNQQYGAPGFPPPVPPQKSKTPIILGVVALVLVLCVGGVTSLYLVGKNAIDETNKALDTAASGLPTTESTSGTETTEPAPPKANITITEPAKLGGRPKLTDEQFADITKELQDGIAADYGAGNSFGAFYGELGSEDIVIAIGVETDVPQPKTALAGTFAGIGIGGLKVNNLTDASTGKLGGVAKCGDGDAEGVDVAVCSWADEGSIGMIMWYFKKAKQVKTEFPKLRAQIETKG
jgi:hypothetical protein